MKKAQKHKKKGVLLAALLLLAALGAAAYRAGLLPQRTYTDADFGIETYRSAVDRDGDGTDDQTDFLRGVRAYLATEPKYQSRYYAGGYPDDGYGVCTDVVAFGLRDAGYDLMALVAEDIAAAPEAYGVGTPDRQIDFRRVRNLNVWLSRHAVTLTTDVSEIAQWQGGDIVVFEGHIGVVSDRRDSRGVPFVLHHGSPMQTAYEQNVLARRKDIVGHYRIS